MDLWSGEDRATGLINQATGKRYTGEMDLIGPRPERPEIIEELLQNVPDFSERLVVRPGITGLAQLRLEADTTLACVRRKVEHDIYYVQHLNPWLDLKLMMFTAVRLARELNRTTWKSIMLPTNDEIAEGFQRAVGLAEEDLGVACFPIAERPRSTVENNSEIVESLAAAE
jgi:hypothetical protein